jgi:hypothetical protein
MSHHASRDPHHHRTRLYKAIERVAGNPMLNLIAGLVLLASGVLESFGEIYEHWLVDTVGVHQGAALFGLIHAFQALPDAMKGLKFIEDGQEAIPALKIPRAPTAAS